MIDSDIQHYWKLVVKRLYNIVPWLGGRLNFAEGGKMFIKNLELAENSSSNSAVCSKISTRRRCG